MTKLIAFTSIAPVLLLCACLDEVEFDVPNEFQNTVVINGKIVKGNPSTVEVTVQNLFDFAFTGESFLNAQSVQLFDENGHKLNLPVKGPGTYELKIYPNSGFDVEIGNSYGIEVKLFSGQSFESELAELVGVPKMQKLESRLVNKEIINFVSEELEVQPVIEYIVNTSLLSDGLERTNLKWDFNRTYKFTDDSSHVCYVTTVVDADLIESVNESQITSSSLDDYLILEQRISQQMVEGQYTFVIQEALDENAIIFWEQVRALSTNNGTFYEPPPGQLITNLKQSNDTEGSVFGFFYATEHDTLKVYVDSTFIDLSIPVCPRPPRAGPPVCDECCSCPRFFSTIKPSYWIN